jgi:hypothetical protein
MKKQRFYKISTIDKIKKILAMIFVAAMIISMAGTLSGWPSLIVVFEEQGMYKELCNENGVILNINFLSVLKEIKSLL